MGKEKDEIQMRLNHLINFSSIDLSRPPLTALPVSGVIGEIGSSGITIGLGAQKCL